MDRPLKIQQLKLQETQAKVQMVGQYMGELDYYPFPFQFELAFRIKTNGFFGLEMALRNTGDQHLPAGLGWHPYFKMSPQIEETQLLLPPVQMVGINDRMIPTGKQYEYDEFERRQPIGSTVLDNCFVVPQTGVETSVHLWSNKGHMRYWQETGPGKFNYLQLFTPPMRESVAIEPMTCNVNAFNNGDGLADLAPNEEIRARVGMVFTKSE
jgi:aldose 1-epimerase